LDAQRGKRVLEKATQYEQTLITTTEPENIRGFFGPAATYFSVAGGGVHPCP
jgi:recombinational DNA repair ATPase RecF